jgi:hypothetical protein
MEGWHPRCGVVPLCISSDSKGTMPSSSLQERVRVLCERAIAAKTQSELDEILPELRAAIRDHRRYLRAIALETIPEAFGTRSNAA